MFEFLFLRIFDNCLFCVLFSESNRLLLGTEEGLYIAELAKDGEFPFLQLCLLRSRSACDSTKAPSLYWPFTIYITPGFFLPILGA